MLGHFRTVVWYTGAEQPGATTQLAVRDFLNEGGKLINAGEQAGGNVDRSAGADTNDFTQYYLGAYGRARGSKSPPPSPAPGARGHRAGRSATRPATRWTPAGAYTVTSDTLKPDAVPAVPAARRAGDYPGVRTPFEPVRGRVVRGGHARRTTPRCGCPAPST